MTDANRLQSLIGPVHAEKMFALMRELPPEAQESWLGRLLRMLTTQDKDVVKLVRRRFPPVGIREFILSPFYLNKAQEVYPKVLVEIEKINTGEYDEVVLTGGIGSAKTTTALYSQAWQLYELSTYNNPHGLFALDSASEIKTIFQSLNARLAKGVDYMRFKTMIETSVYFQQHFPFDPKVESMLRFPNRIEVEPVAGTQTAAIGQNVIGGIVDEVNFMQVVEKSLKSGDGGSFDQARVLYNSIAMRRKSRFVRAGGGMPGLLCLVSSRKVPGQFTDQKEAEAKTNKRIYVYDKRAWDIVEDDSGRYSGEKFTIFIGDESREPRVLQPDEAIDPEDEKNNLIDYIPVEYKQPFLDNITDALRDVAGKSTRAIHPYLPRRRDVVSNFGRRQSLFKQETIDLTKQKGDVRLQLIARNFKSPRWLHIDLGLTSDSAGICVGHVPGFTEIDRQGYKEILPLIEIDFCLEVIPPKSMSGEIDFARIRQVIFKLRDLGLPIRWASLDTHQSVDTLQILRQQGFVVGVQSIDTDMMPYDVTKQALYDRRVVMPHHQKLQKELVSLERDYKKDKIDHPTPGSKDCADALAGVVFGLSMRREIWTQFRIPVERCISLAMLMRERETHASKRSVPLRAEA
jgi:hypothetical protein